MSDATTEHGRYVFKVCEGARADDPCWIALECSRDDLEVLGNGFLGLVLRPESADYAQALELAQLLNGRVEAVSYTHFPDEEP